MGGLLYDIVCIHFIVGRNLIEISGTVEAFMYKDKGIILLPFILYQI